MKRGLDLKIKEEGGELLHSNSSAESAREPRSQNGGGRVNRKKKRETKEKEVKRRKLPANVIAKTNQNIIVPLLGERKAERSEKEGGSRRPEK